MNTPIFSQGFDDGRKEFLRDNDLIHFGMQYVKDCEIRAIQQLEYLREECQDVEWIDTQFNNLVAEGQHPPGVNFFKDVEFLYACQGPLMTLADRMIEYRMAERFFGGKDGENFENDKSSGSHAAQIYLWLQFKRTATQLGHVDDSSEDEEGGGFAPPSDEDEGNDTFSKQDEDEGDTAPPDEDEGSDTSSKQDEGDTADEGSREVVTSDAYPAASESIQVVTDESSSKTGALRTPELDEEALIEEFRQESIENQTVEINKEITKFNEWYSKLFADLKTAMETYSAIEEDDTFAGKEIIEILNELTLAYFDDMQDTWIGIKDAARGNKFEEKLLEFELTLLPHPDYEVKWDGEKFFKSVPGKRQSTKKYKELKDVFKSLWNSIDWGSFEFVNKTSELTRKLTATHLMTGMHEILNGKGSKLNVRDERRSIQVSISYFWLKAFLLKILDIRKKEVEKLPDLSERDFIFRLIGMFWETPISEIIRAASTNLNGPYFENKNYEILNSTTLYLAALGCNTWIFHVIPIAIKHGFEGIEEDQLTLELDDLIQRWVTAVLEQNGNKTVIQKFIKKAAVLYTAQPRDYNALAQNIQEFLRSYRKPEEARSTDV